MRLSTGTTLARPLSEPQPRGIQMLDEHIFHSVTQFPPNLTTAQAGGTPSFLSSAGGRGLSLPQEDPGPRGWFKHRPPDGPPPLSCCSAGSAPPPPGTLISSASSSWRVFLPPCPDGPPASLSPLESHLPGSFHNPTRAQAGHPAAEPSSPEQGPGSGSELPGEPAVLQGHLCSGKSRGRGRGPGWEARSASALALACVWGAESKPPWASVRTVRRCSQSSDPCLCGADGFSIVLSSHVKMCLL